MKLIMENWRKYLVNESEKDTEHLPLSPYFLSAMGGIISDGNDVVLNYFKSLGLAVLKMKNIYQQSFSQFQGDVEIGLMNRFFQTCPDSMGYVGSIDDLKQEIEEKHGPLGEPELFEKDMKRIHNHLSNAGIPTFSASGPGGYTFLLDSGGNAPIKISLADRLEGTPEPGFGEFLFSIPAPEPGDVITVGLADGSVRLPLPSQIQAESNPETKARSKATFARSIIVKRNGNKVNFQPEFGKSV